MGIVLNLESFDPETEVRPEVPLATYEDGYAEGHAAALQSCAADQSALKQTLVQMLNDSAFGYHEAQEHFLNGLQVYLDALLDRILPAALVPALHAELIAILKDGAVKASKNPITLKVSGDQFAAVSGIVTELDMAHVNVVQDASLSAHAAFISRADSEVKLDVDAALAAIANHSAILLQPTEKVS